MASDDMADLAMDAGDLYREEVFTDRRVGTIRRMTPVRVDGSTDDGRPVSYVGQTQILTPMGTLPLSFEIEARSLEEAVANFAAAAQVAVDQAMDELRELRREAASSIVVPGSGGGAGGGTGHGGMGGPGGGFQLP